MAITKNQLKMIVKECLIEILAEGMGSNVASNISEATVKKPVQKQQSPHLSTVLQQNASKIKPALPANNPALREAIKREAAGNSVMAEILADTANNTLPTMLENDRTKLAQMPPVGTVERTVAVSTPEQLFGSDAASKWAALAFMDGPKK